MLRFAVVVWACWATSGYVWRDV